MNLLTRHLHLSSCLHFSNPNILHDLKKCVASYNDVDLIKPQSWLRQPTHLFKREAEWLRGVDSLDTVHKLHHHFD